MLGIDGNYEDKPRATIIVVKEGMPTIDPGRILNYKTSNLGLYEDVTPVIDESDAEIRFVHADCIIERPLRVHDHICPPSDFCELHYFGNMSWKDAMKPSQIVEGESEMDEIFRMTQATWGIRKKHPYFYLVGAYWQWHHLINHENCECDDRPHKEGEYILCIMQK